MKWSLDQFNPECQNSAVGKKKSDRQTGLVTKRQDALSAQTHRYTPTHTYMTGAGSLHCSLLWTHVTHFMTTQKVVYISVIKHTLLRSNMLTFTQHTLLSVLGDFPLLTFHTRCHLLWCHQTAPTQLLRPASAHTLIWCTPTWTHTHMNSLPEANGCRRTVYFITCWWKTTSFYLNVQALQVLTTFDQEDFISSCSF